jgi:hypothetical protein
MVTQAQAYSRCNLTIRSSRPRIVASAMCFTLRLHMSAAPPRGGLTQALALMAVWRYVHFENKEAQRLADLNGITYDLHLVGSICDQFLQIENNFSTESSLISQCLFISAVVTYGRTLNSGVRSGVTRQQIEQLPIELQEQHQYFKDIRDKFIAHSVNAFEENCVKIYLTPEERGERSVSSIGLGHSRVIALSHQDMQSLKNLAAIVLAIVKYEMKYEEDRLLQFARSLPVDDFYNAPEPTAFYGGNSSPGNVRKKPGEG